MTIISCENNLENSMEDFDISNFEVSACDCPPPGLGGSGNTSGSNDHIFKNYNYYGDITISNFTNIALNIQNKSLLKFSYGINLVNGQIDDVALGNILPKSGVTLIDYSYDKDYYIFNLKVKGYITKFEWDDDKKEYVWKKKTVYTYVVVKIETYKLPSYSGSQGGDKVFPYDL